MRFPRVETFNEEDEFKDVIRCDSELSPSVMDSKIEEHFDTCGMEYPHFLILMQFLYDIHPPYYPKSHCSDDNEMFGIIKYIVKHYKCNVYLFQSDLGVETLLRIVKENIICFVYLMEWNTILLFHHEKNLLVILLKETKIEKR